MIKVGKKSQSILMTCDASQVRDLKAAEFSLISYPVLSANFNPAKPISPKNGNIVAFFPFIVLEGIPSENRLRVKVHPKYIYLFNGLI